jgi:hypothetical protein
MRTKITLALACACSLAVALIGAATLRAEPSPEPTTPEPTTPEPTPEPTTTTAVPKAKPRVKAKPRINWRKLQRRVTYYRRETWYWQRTMGRRITRELRNSPRSRTAKVAAWKRVARKIRLVAQNPPHKAGWLCIHRYEGSWTDGGGPYYGGLQMDLGFQQAYGLDLLRRKGTADRWTPLEQMWVAERAHRAGRGFYPWPNTARYCGLL